MLEMAEVHGCDNACHTKRTHLYVFYSLLLASLLMLALVHFIFFLSSRRKNKFEAREYASRKLEFVTLGVSDLQPSEKETTKVKENDDEGVYTVSPEPFTTRSSSAINRVLNFNGGINSVQLEPMDEESGMRQRETFVSKRKSSTSSVRGRSVAGGMQDPVIVTVATVSAIFQQHEILDAVVTNSPDSPGSISDVLDISDLVSSRRNSLLVVADQSEEPLEIKLDRNDSILKVETVEESGDNRKLDALNEVKGKLGSLRRGQANKWKPPTDEAVPSDYSLIPIAKGLQQDSDVTH